MQRTGSDLHRLAIASKDGEWILQEDREALTHVLGVLAAHGAHYRFGAPLDMRWMSGGWSAHFQFQQDLTRVRTDFFTQPPRVHAADLARMWAQQEGRDPPFTDARMFAEMKKTDRQKDYAFIGEIARRMETPRDRLLYSRSADDLITLAQEHTDLAHTLSSERTLLANIGTSRRALAEALQLEMLDLMEANERRLESYRAASSKWASAWPALSREMHQVPLSAAHALMVTRANGVLPERVSS